jgi:hypothetical protein
MRHVRVSDAASCLAAGGATVLLASDQGGFFDRTWPWAVLLLGAIAALALLGAAELEASLATMALVGGLLLLAGWTVLSWSWSSEPGTSLHEALRTPIYVVAALAFVTLAAAGGERGLIVGVAVGTAGIAAYSLAERHLHGVRASDQQSTLLERPLGYANALGALCGIGLLLTVGLAFVVRRNRAASVAALAAGAVLVVALALTGSRGAWVAIAAGAAVAVATQLGRTIAFLAAAAVAGALAFLYVAAALTTPARLQARGDYWHVTWHVAGQHPLGGLGAGTFDLAWAAYGNVAQWGGALDAHSLYLEMLAELGVVGLLLTATLVLPVAAALRGARPTATGAAAVGGSVAFLVHAGLDWDWEVPAVTVAGLACLAATLGSAPKTTVIGRRARITLLGVALAAIVGYAIEIAVRAF